MDPLTTGTVGLNSIHQTVVMDLGSTVRCVILVPSTCIVVLTGLGSGGIIRGHYISLTEARSKGRKEVLLDTIIINDPCDTVSGSGKPAKRKHMRVPPKLDLNDGSSAAATSRLLPDSSKKPTSDAIPPATVPPVLLRLAPVQKSGACQDGIRVSPNRPFRPMGSHTRISFEKQHNWGECV